VDELEFLVENVGVNKIFFTDSVLNLDYGHLKETCVAIKNKNVDVEWGANYSPDLKFLDLLPLMKESGAAHLAVGMESLSPDMLSALQKERFVDDAVATTNECSNLEIEQLIHIMFGSPGETAETVRTTFARLDEIRPYTYIGWQGDRDVLIFPAIRIYPKTRIEKIAIQEGVIPEGSPLLKPKFYISPTIKEIELFTLIREYLDAHPRWMCPALGINNPPEFSELADIQFEIYQK
jgi:radical SAM superfamily enzyme YgiQ (UPF0313 family)